MKIYFHVDVDSPEVLSRFYGDEPRNYSPADLERFYTIGFERANAFFEEEGIKATFFCVGKELESSSVIQKIIQDTFAKGHEIANHTYTHPFGLCTLPEKDIELEIEKCNEAIQAITGERPIGFRTPGYAISSAVVNTLDKLGMKYDSSAAWPLMIYATKLLKYYYWLKKIPIRMGFGSGNIFFINKPYFPSEKLWLIKKKGNAANRIVELPLPHAYGVLPFYNNLLLGLNEQRIQKLCGATKTKSLVYLMHLIEFFDVNDGFLPDSVKKHPHVKVPYAEKKKKMKTIVATLLKRYQATITTSGDYI